MSNFGHYSSTYLVQTATITQDRDKLITRYGRN